MRPLIIIPARSGSKEIPDKNIKLLNGKPLVHYSIEFARKISNDSLICVTTDSAEISLIAEQTGLKIPFLRPAELATDNVGMSEVLLHVIDFYSKRKIEFDCVVLLQPTSPFRKIEDFWKAIQKYKSSLDMVVSVKITKSNPYFTLYEEDANGLLEKSKKLESIDRRQDAPNVYELNGSMYIINPKSLIEKKKLSEFSRIEKVVMDHFHSIDIDTMEDWMYCEFLISKYKDVVINES